MLTPKATAAAVFGLSKNKMIILKLRGGVGNQMFQYAFGKSLAIRRDEKLILDLSDYGLSNRTFSLDSINIKYDFKLENHLISKLLHKIFRSKIFVDTSPEGSQSILENLKGKILISGYWESPKFFKDIENIIKKEFTLKRVSGYFKKKSEQIQKDSISIHVRRGDYLIPHGKYLNGIEYYDSAVKKILKIKNVINPQITTFSDDKDWCRKKMSVLCGIKTEIFDDPEIDDVEELILMSQYNHNVISNSTFSWWSAYLNKNPDKIIIAPKNWFTDPKQNKKQIEHIMLKSWILL